MKVGENEKKGINTHIVTNTNRNMHSQNISLTLQALACQRVTCYILRYNVTLDYNINSYVCCITYVIVTL